MFDDDIFGLGKPKKEKPKVKRKRKLTEPDKLRIVRKQDFKCARCGEPMKHWDVDHIVPIEEGGSDTEENLQALHPNCHREKTEEDRARKRQKKFKKEEKKEREEAKRPNDPLGGGLLGGGDLFGESKPKKRRSKKKDPFDLGF